MAEMQIRMDHIDQVRWREPATEALAPGRVRCRVDHFAFTANNISYADHGKRLGYWHFFPAADGGGEWGIVPVWGFAEVTESTCDELPPGERLFGYWPMAGECVLSVGEVSKGTVMENSLHRASLAPAYNRYNRTSADPTWSPEAEPLQALLRPLFLTAFVADDFIAQHEFFGATRVLISSASAKTALAIGFQLRQRDGIAVTGLTSDGNRAFAESLDVYDNVVTYADIASLNADDRWVYVDIAGSTAIRNQVHGHLKDQLRHSCAIGGSHWQDRTDEPLPAGPEPKFLFAPAHIDQRISDWGAAGFQQRFGAAWVNFAATANGWLEVTEVAGPQAVEQLYADMLSGSADPRRGYMARLP
ncbi:MAG: DUF2855 family protein [Pseudomonadota bacterium]